MHIKLEMESQTPLYQQIVDQVVRGIQNGSLEPGEPLPSARRLASDIGINIHTVSKSYKILQQRGFIQMHRRKGAIVEQSLELNIDLQDIKYLNEMLRPVVNWAISNRVPLNKINIILAELFQSINNDAGGKVK